VNRWLEAAGLETWPVVLRTETYIVLENPLSP